ncbi:RNA dependent RNA polymerase-domain-containing protein [Mycena vulgaris]|nr:RNA dependent RNA polymerase-domain-containing protein [Mycena vulgaris]
MGDVEMTASQVAYHQLDQSYPPEFWDAALQIPDGGKLTLSQGSSVSESAITAATVSLSNIGKGTEKPVEMVIKTPTNAFPRVLDSPSRTVGILQINQSPSRSPRSMPSMAAPRGIPSAVSCGNLFVGIGVKRSSSSTELPPTKIRKVSAPATACNAQPTGGPSSKPPSSKPGIKPATPETPSDAFSLPFLFRGHHGLHLKPYLISHSADLQPELDRLQIARGVQWELARGVQSGSWTWDDVKANLDKLTGANADIAPGVRSTILGEPSRLCTPHELSLWQELDREAKATVENKSRGLGLMGEFESIPDYFGGNVQFSIRLLDAGAGKEPRVRLEPLQMTRSNHLARELGSVSVIALRDDKDGALVRKWAARKFIFCGRAYIALPPKSGKVYLIETDENCGRTPQEWCGDQHRISYDEYIRRNNPLDYNAEQPFAKYLTRLNLYLSTSIPALEFVNENIEFIDDQYADGWSKDQKPPTEAIMTDGSGFINRAAAAMISSKLKYDRLPVAYQGRILGSKGLWILHPDDESPEPRIWIRPSQRKIVMRPGRPPHRAHRIFDLLSVSGPSSSLNLSAQAIIILANNGVPTEVFCKLQEQGLKDLITPLLDWNRPNATAYLWDAINTVGNVTRSRLQRLAAGASRALGFEKRLFDNDKSDEDPDKDPDLRELPHTGRNAFNGEPLTVQEVAMDLLQAGFDPQQSPFLSTKIYNFVKSTMEIHLAKYRIPLANSLEAYIIPDPSGELKEGEVFFKSSIDPDGPLREQVVVGRYPMRESSDMQKVTAVDKPALAKYVDVLIISVHGCRSLASLLAGGDTDGDEAIIIREPAIVAAFQNQPFVPVPEGFLARNFERQVQSVTAFGDKLGRMPIAEAQCTFAEAILAGLADDKIGLYSRFHDCAVHKHGLDHPKTRRIAHMTFTLLDASKTGLRLLATVGKVDEAEYCNPPKRPKCFDPKHGFEKKRKPKLGPFVLDCLLAAGVVTRGNLMVELDSVSTHVNDNSTVEDLDIEEPYRHAQEIADGNTSIAPTLSQELEVLKSHVQNLRAQWVRQANKDPRYQSRNHKKRPSKQTDNLMLPIMRDFRQPLKGVDLLASLWDINEIKASYAFMLANNFGFSMAFQDVCEIKRRAEMKRGPYNKVTVIDNAKNMGGAARRLFKHMGDRE